MFNSHKEDDIFGPIVEVMERKFKKYWVKIPLLYCFSFILDPRVKYNGLNCIVSDMGDQLNLDYTSQTTNAREKLFQLYGMYENKFGNLMHQEGTTSPYTKYDKELEFNSKNGR